MPDDRKNLTKINEFTERHRKHLLKIRQNADHLIEMKYRRGVQEHGGHMEEYPVFTLLDFAIEEAIDQVVYLLTLKDKLREQVDKLECVL